MPKVSDMTATPAYAPGDALYAVTGGNSRKLLTMRVTNIAAMQAILVPTNGMSVEVTEAGRGGLFVFDTSLTASANLGTTFKATDATTGSWARRFSGPVDVRWFGASASAAGSANATAIQAAIDSAAAVYIPAGTYAISAEITLAASAQIRIYGDGPQSTILQADNAAVVNAVLSKPVGGSPRILISGMTIDANDHAAYALEIQEASNSDVSNLRLVGATTACLVTGPAAAGAPTVNSCNFWNIEANAENAASHAVHMRAGTADCFWRHINASNATVSCVLINGGGNSLIDVRTFGSLNPPIGFDIDGSNTDMILCLAGNHSNVAFKVQRSNVIVAECEARWDEAILAEYAVSIAAGLKNIRLTGRSVGGSDVEQVQFADVAPDRSIMTMWSAIVGATSNPTVPSFHRMGTPLHDLLVGTFDTTPGNNNSDTAADAGVYLSGDGRISAAAYQLTPATFNRTGNNGPAITFLRSGVTAGYIDVQSGLLRIETPSTNNLEFQVGGDLIISAGLTEYADDATAAAGGVPVNGLYKNGSVVRIRVV